MGNYLLFLFEYRPWKKRNEQSRRFVTSRSCHAARSRGSVSEQRNASAVLPPQLCGERKRASRAARAAHADQDALLLFFGEIGTVQHPRGLLLEQFVQRQIAGHDLIFVHAGAADDRRLAHRASDDRLWFLRGHFATFFMER